jgi:predicted dehydrogenase
MVQYIYVFIGFLSYPSNSCSQECREIIKVAKESNKILQIGFVLRCHPVFLGIKKELDAGTIGQLLSINCSESIKVMHGASYMRRWHRKSINSGGFLLAKCSHDLDVMSDFVGALPTKVSSFGNLNYFTSDKLKVQYCSLCKDENCRFRFQGEMVMMTPQEKAAPSIKGFDLCVYNNDKDVIDNQHVLLEYSNNVRGTFSLNLFAPEPKREWRLIGTNGYINADTAKKEYTVSFSDGRTSYTKKCEVDNKSAHDGSDMVFLNEFINNIILGKAPNADANAGLSSTVIGNAIEKARKTGTVVTIDASEYE